MSSEYTPTRGRRSSSRRGDGRSGRPNRDGARRRQETAPQKPEKKTLWQKVLSIFGGKPAVKSHAESNGRPRIQPERSERQDRPARSERPRNERPSGFRTPELVEVTSPRIYVGNLSFDATESDLFELFNGVGVVQNVEVVSNKHTQKSKGFAFVQMQSTEEAQRAVSELHDKEYMGRKLVVSGAKAVEERRERAPRPSESEQSEVPEASE